MNISSICFKLIDLFSVNKQITIIMIVMQAQAKFCLCFPKINTKFFSAAPILPWILPVGLSRNTKNYSCNQYKMMNYYHHQKLQHL